MAGLAGGPTTFQIANSSHFRIVRVEQNGVVQSRGVDIKEGEDVSGVRVIMAYGNASIRGSVEITNGPLPSGAQFSVGLRTIADDPGSSSSVYSSVEVDARGQFVVEGVFPGTYEISVTIWSADGRAVLSEKKQQVAVTAGSINNVTLSLEINAKATRP